MVHGEQHDVFLRCQSQQAHPQQWLGAQIEGARGFLCGKTMCFRATFFRRQSAQINERHQRIGKRRDALHGLPFDLHEACAERLVTAHHLGHAVPQRRSVQLTAQTHRRRNVIRGVAGHELIQKPEALLRVGELLRFLVGQAGDNVVDFAFTDYRFAHRFEEQGAFGR